MKQIKSFMDGVFSPVMVEHDGVMDEWTVESAEIFAFIACNRYDYDQYKRTRFPLSRALGDLSRRDDMNFDCGFRLVETVVDGMRL